MINPARPLPARSDELDFWQHVLADRALERCGNLEKLLVGCEIIAALDDSTMLERIAA